MRSLPKRHCARGQDCYQVRKLGLEEPAPLRASRHSDLCDKCEREPAAADACDELSKAARVLLASGITGEDEVIPTLAFANRISHDACFAGIKDAFLRAHAGTKRWRELTLKFSNTFEPFTVERVLNGVLVVKRQTAFAGIHYDDNSGVVKGISLEATDRATKPPRMSNLYEEALSLEGIPYDRSDRGNVSWKIYRGRIRLMVEPENIHITWIPQLPAYGEQQPFPPPLVIKGFCEVLWGSRSEGKFEGFSHTLEGRQKGTKHGTGGRRSKSGADPLDLVSVCTALYLEQRYGKGGSSPRAEAIATLNNRVLVACGKEALPEAGAGTAIWKRGKVTVRMATIDEAMDDAARRFGLHPRDKYF